MIEQKQALLKEALWKYGHVREDFIRRFREAPDDLHYRSACKLPFRERDGKLINGMYAPGTNRFIPLDTCPVHTEELEAVRKGILDVLNECGARAFDLKTGTGLRYLVLRVIQGHAQCALITGRNTKISPECVGKIMKIEGMESLVQSVNSDRHSRAFFGSRSKVLAGKDHIMITIDDIRLRLSAESFFQLNVEQAVRMYRTAVDKVQNSRALVETYCGVGAMSLLAGNRSEFILGIENVPQAIRNAEYNAEINGAEHVHFLCADAAEGYLEAVRTKRFDTMLADPPRSGMDEKMLEALAEYPVDRLIYISCNPVTLGKNLKELKKTYELRSVIPFDLFPETPLVESVSILTRRGVKNL